MAPKRGAARRSHLTELNRLRSEAKVNVSTSGNEPGIVDSVAVSSCDASLVLGSAVQGCVQPSGISTSAGASVLLSPQVHMSGIGSIVASSDESVAGSEQARPFRSAGNVQSRVRLPGVDSSSEELSAGHVSQDHGQAKLKGLVETSNCQGRVRLLGIDCSSDHEASGRELSTHVKHVQKRVRLAGVDSSSDDDAADNVQPNLQGRVRLPGMDSSSDDEATGPELSSHVKHAEKRVRLAGIESSSDDDAADIVQPGLSGGIAGASVLRRSARIRSRELHDVGRNVERGSAVRRPKRKRGSGDLDALGDKRFRGQHLDMHFCLARGKVWGSAGKCR